MGICDQRASLQLRGSYSLESAPLLMTNVEGVEPIEESIRLARTELPNLQIWKLLQVLEQKQKI